MGFIVTKLLLAIEAWWYGFYNGRGTAEQWIKEGKKRREMDEALPAGTFKDNQAPLATVSRWPYNLAKLPAAVWRFPRPVSHWTLTTLREKLIKIGAKVVRHSKYVTFPTGGGGGFPESCSRQFWSGSSGWQCRLHRLEERMRSTDETDSDGNCGESRAHQSPKPRVRPPGRGVAIRFFGQTKNGSQAQKIRWGAQTRGGRDGKMDGPNEPGSAPGSAHMGNVGQYVWPSPR